MSDEVQPVEPVEPVEPTDETPVHVGPEATDPLDSVRAAARELSQWRQKKRQEASEAQPTEDLAQEASPEPAQEQPIGETEGEPEPQEEPAPIELPESWSADEAERFQSLPPETQEYLVNRERERNADIRRRQNELAERMKGLEPEQQALAQARQQYEQALPQVLHMLQSTGEFADIKSMEDVEALARDDWPRYVQWDAHNRKIQSIQHELAQVQQREAYEYQVNWDNYAQEQDRLFAEKVPEIADPEKGKELQDLALNTLQNDYGFTPEEMQMAWGGAFRDYRVQMLLLDAARYRQLKKNPPKPAKKPVPPVQKPGSAPARSAIEQEEVKKLEERLNQTGNIRDAAKLMAARRRMAS